ncbi:hypothetical protein [Thiohalobacter sp.]|uniref:hypothetical protein n=1 Tax=Thiohalobacter sp. TaxID=2025948 RepID=UPI00261439D8|nr:hypothetical protein [Thiohalobacter sp.]
MAELTLPELVGTRDRDALAAAVREALIGRDADALPLQQALTHGSVAVGGVREVLLISSREAGGRLLIRVGLFFTSLIAGCNCADDPTPADLLEEYGEFDLEMDARTGKGDIRPTA